MLLFEQRVGALERLIPLHRPRRRDLHRLWQRHATAQHAIAGFLSPARQHERMNLEGVRDGPHFYAFNWLSVTALSLNSKL